MLSQVHNKVNVFFNYRPWRRERGVGPLTAVDGILTSRPVSSTESTSTPLSLASSSAETLYRAAILAIVSPLPALTDFKLAAAVDLARTSATLRVELFGTTN